MRFVGAGEITIETGVLAAVMVLFVSHLLVPEVALKLVAKY
jgi:hypothetical protein